MRIATQAQTKLQTLITLVGAGIVRKRLRPQNIRWVEPQGLRYEQASS